MLVYTQHIYLSISRGIRRPISYNEQITHVHQWQNIYGSGASLTWMSPSPAESNNVHQWHCFKHHRALFGAATNHASLFMCIYIYICLCVIYIYIYIYNMYIYIYIYMYMSIHLP